MDVHVLSTLVVCERERKENGESFERSQYLETEKIQPFPEWTFFGHRFCCSQDFGTTVFHISSNSMVSSTCSYTLRLVPYLASLRENLLRSSTVSLLMYWILVIWSLGVGEQLQPSRGLLSLDKTTLPTNFSPRT